MKNALLLFLSIIHLGKNNELIETTYSTENFGDITCVQTNEAAVKYIARYLSSKGEKLDYVFVFSTQKTHELVEYHTLNDSKIIKKRQHDIFIERVENEVPELKSKISIVDYDENVSSNDVVGYVLKMAEKIHDIVNQNPNDWILHTDLTGGLRHAVVLMLSVQHLMKHSGIGIGNAIYANYFMANQSRNRIEDVTAIHKLFEMVSSTDLFMNYANIRELHEYFNSIPNDEKSMELNALLIALGEFSDAVSICRTGYFESALIKLRDSLLAFKVYQNKSIQERLFAEIIKSMENDYEEIIKDHVSRLSIIKWCIRKKFLQQAMTLFNEWFPKEIVDRKIYYPNAKYELLIHDKCTSLNKGYKKVENVFVQEYYGTINSLNVFDSHSNSNTSVMQVRSKKIFAQFREYASIFFQGNWDGNIPISVIERLKYEINLLDSLKDRLQARKIKMTYIKSNYPMLCKCIYKKQEGDAYRCNMERDRYFMDRVVSKDTIYKFLATAKNEFLYDLFGIEPDEDNNKLEDIHDKTEENNNTLMRIEERWQARENQVIDMLNNNISCTNFSISDTLDILKADHWIRIQRNQINHAYSGADVASSKQIEEVMLKAISLIEG